MRITHDFSIATAHQGERNSSPTAEAYGEIQAAYDFFNRQLFSGALPPCLITLQRSSRRTPGFYCAKRFANVAGKTTDEIALNPRHFKHRSFVEVTSTLVHEMVHLWQHHFGHPSRVGYHNKEWAGEMLRLGLHPSHTGQPGGRMRGQQMTHYVIPGGRFEISAKKLLASPLAISWFDADGVLPLRRGAHDFSLLSLHDNSGRRTKFTCPGCGDNAWGKASLNLLCLDCELGMQRA